MLFLLLALFLPACYCLSPISTAKLGIFLQTTTLDDDAKKIFTKFTTGDSKILDMTQTEEFWKGKFKAGWAGSVKFIESNNEGYNLDLEDHDSAKSPGLQRAYFNALERCLTRVTTDFGANVFDVFKTGTLTSPKLADIAYAGSDPHGEYESVAMLTIRAGEKTLKVVYKPSSVAGHFWVTGDHDDSLVNQVNSKLGNALTRWGLPSYKVVRRKDHEHPYGYLEFVEKNQDIVGMMGKDRQLKKFSYKAGVLAFIVWLSRMTDMHLENIISNVANGPYIIDAETAFNPDPDFGFAQSAIFSELGAFSRYDPLTIEYLVGKKDINSLIKYEGEWTAPTQQHVRDGFTAAYNAVMGDKAHFNLWADRLGADDGAFCRIVPIGTQDAIALRSSIILEGTTCAASIKKFVMPGFMCPIVMGLFSGDCRAGDIFTVNPESAVGLSVPNSLFLRPNSKKLWKADCITELAINGLPTARGSYSLDDNDAGNACFAHLQEQGPNKKDFFPKTPVALLKERIASMDTTLRAQVLATIVIGA